MRNIVEPAVSPSIESEELLTMEGRNSVEGFYCGGDLWKLRFVPEEAGQYRYILRGERVALFAQGRMNTGLPRERGFIRIHPRNPYAFRLLRRDCVFSMGDTCYGLHNGSPVTPELHSHASDSDGAYPGVA